MFEVLRRLHDYHTRGVKFCVSCSGGLLLPCVSQKCTNSNDTLDVSYNLSFSGMCPEVDSIWCLDRRVYLTHEVCLIHTKVYIKNLLLLLILSDSRLNSCRVNSFESKYSPRRSYLCLFFVFFGISMLTDQYNRLIEMEFVWLVW